MNLSSLPQGVEPYFTQYVKFIQSYPSISYEKGKTHKHHIYPKALGGLNEKFNFIILTSEDHYTVHYLLWKCYGGKMAKAFHLMTNLHNTRRLSKEEYSLLQKESSNSSRGNKYALGSHHTEKIKKEQSERVSGSRNPMYRKNALNYMSDDALKNWKNKQSICRLGKPPLHGFTQEVRNKMSEGRKNKPTNRKVLCIETSTCYNSIVIASMKTQANKVSISKVCKGQRQTAGGYHWQYA